MRLPLVRWTSLVLHSKISSYCLARKGPQVSPDLLGPSQRPPRQRPNGATRQNPPAAKQMLYRTGAVTSFLTVICHLSWLTYSCTSHTAGAHQSDPTPHSGGQDHLQNFLGEVPLNQQQSHRWSGDICSQLGLLFLRFCSPQRDGLQEGQAGSQVSRLQTLTLPNGVSSFSPFCLLSDTLLLPSSLNTKIIPFQAYLVLILRRLLLEILTYSWTVFLSIPLVFPNFSGLPKGEQSTQQYYLAITPPPRFTLEYELLGKQFSTRR